jgi:hypothetical protein
MRLGSNHGKTWSEGKRVCKGLDGPAESNQARRRRLGLVAVSWQESEILAYSRRFLPPVKLAAAARCFPPAYPTI